MPLPAAYSSAGRARSRRPARSAPIACSNAASGELNVPCRAAAPDAEASTATSASPTSDLANLDIRVTDNFRLSARMGDSTVSRRPNLIRILLQHPALIRIGGGPPRLTTRFELGFVDKKVERAFFGVYGDNVTIAHERDWTADGCLGTHMADAEAARCARETAVRDERDGLSHTAAVKGCGGGQHLTHAGAALRTFVPDDDDLVRVDLSLLHSSEGVLLAIEAAGRPLKLQLLHAGDLHDGPSRRERALQANDTASRRDRVGNGVDHLLVGVELHVLEVLLNGLAGDRQAVLVQVAAVEQRPHNLRHTADLVGGLWHVFAAGLQVGDVGRAFEDFGYVKQVEVDTALVRHGGQVQCRVGRAAGGRDHRRRVLKVLAGSDIARADALGQKPHHGLTALDSVVLTIGVGSRCPC